MTVEEMINSDDKEIAEMGCTLFMKEKDTTVDQLRKMLNKFGKYNILIVSNHQVELTHRIRYFNNSSIFVKDPTRTVLIECK